MGTISIFIAALLRRTLNGALQCSVTSKAPHTLRTGGLTAKKERFPLSCAYTSPYTHIYVYPHFCVFAQMRAHAVHGSVREQSSEENSP